MQGGWSKPTQPIFTLYDTRGFSVRMLALREISTGTCQNISSLFFFEIFKPAMMAEKGGPRTQKHTLLVTSTSQKHSQTV